MFASTPDCSILLISASTTMKISLPHLLLGLGCFCAFTQFLGCMPAGGRGTFPIGSPGQPVGGYNPYPYPGGYPPFPGGPGIPVVLNPGTTPPSPPVPNPGSTPTIPIGLPTPTPTLPKDDSTDFWSPWPLPPRANQLTARAGGLEDTFTDGVVNRTAARPGGLNGAGPGDSDSYVRQSQLIDDASPAPNEDLRYRGGRTIRDLSYVNLYISGDTAWSKADVERIDGSLSAAMRDQYLNNVLLQYYNNQPISSTALPSHPLVGYTPKTVTRGDIQNFAAYLHQQGFLQSYDLKNTVFNFLLPPGTVLTADNRAANAQRETSNAQTFETFDVVPKNEEVDSAKGLGGYHGSVVTSNGGRIYFSVDVYSQRFANGSTNGIPVFNEPWKNVVATLYHQLVEARTDPDVEDAIRGSSDLNSDRYLGWVSDSGQEIGDFPIHANVPITSVIREVPLADGSGTVPVQLPYSNFVHGPEGPIAQSHPLPLR